MHFKDFKNIILNGYRENELACRNNEKIRKILAEVICIICISKKNYNLKTINIKSEEEFDFLNLTNKLFRWNCRINRVDTPEIRTKNKKEKEYGKVVRDALREKILNKLVFVKCLDFDKYGRLLTEIYFNEDYNYENIDSMLKDIHLKFNTEYKGINYKHRSNLKEVDIVVDKDLIETIKHIYAKDFEIYNSVKQ